MPACAPMLATMATVTKRMRDDIIDKLDMAGCCLVYESPNKPNICYEFQCKKTVEEDFESVVRYLAVNKIKAQAYSGVLSISGHVFISLCSLSPHSTRCKLLSNGC